MALHPLKRAERAQRTVPDGDPRFAVGGDLVVDAEGLIHYANLSAEQFFGVGRARLVGHPLSEFMPDDTPLFSLLEQVAGDGRRGG